MEPESHIIVIAGPNGAGKSTAAPGILRDYLGITQFVNADVIAQGLSAYAPERAALQAGRIMLGRLKELAAARESFAFETTLAARSFAPWLAGLRESGKTVHLFYLQLPSAEMAVQRVADRVRQGGHDIPEATIRRRYRAGLENFFGLYRPLAHSCRFYDNSSFADPQRVASGSGSAGTETILQPALWRRVKTSIQFDESE